jgi:hypothetical protein
MIVTKHTVIVYAIDPLSGQRLISAVHECDSRTAAEQLAQTVSRMLSGTPLAEVVLYSEYEEEVSGQSLSETIASWDEDPAQDPFPLEYGIL